MIFAPRVAIGITVTTLLVVVSAVVITIQNNPNIRGQGAGVCGDGTMNAAETCDDGNVNSNDGCSALCQLETVGCGDGIVQAGEQCDDGNTNDTDTCSNSCRHVVCNANGICEAWEYNACPAECPPAGNSSSASPACNFNNICDPQETFNSCPAECPNTSSSSAPVCNANGMCEAWEVGKCPAECSDGSSGSSRVSSRASLASSRSSRASTASSSAAVACGNGIVQGTEQCDDGDKNDKDECTNTCGIARCGDGVRRTGTEQCDDGNQKSGDGCSVTCTVESGWSCEERAPNNDLCTKLCGNLVTDAGEQCDDGNTLNGDNCTAACACPTGMISDGKGSCKCANIPQGFCCEDLDKDKDGEVEDKTEVSISRGVTDKCGGIICNWCYDAKKCNTSVVPHCASCGMKQDANGNPVYEPGCACDRPNDKDPNCSATWCVATNGTYSGPACTTKCGSPTQLNCYTIVSNKRLKRGLYTGKLLCVTPSSGESEDATCVSDMSWGGSTTGGGSGGGSSESGFPPGPEAPEEPEDPGSDGGDTGDTGGTAGDDDPPGGPGSSAPGGPPPPTSAGGGSSRGSTQSSMRSSQASRTSGSSSQSSASSRSSSLSSASRSSRSASISSRSSGRSSASSIMVGGACLGNECSNGGDQFCSGQGAQSCVLAGNFPCIQCVGGSIASVRSSSSDASGLRPAAQSSRSSARSSVANICSPLDCMNGGDSFCAGQGKTCSVLNDLPCIQCVGSSVSSSRSSALSSALTLRTSSVSSSTAPVLSCGGDECSFGGQDVCASRGLDCVHINTAPCIQCVGVAPSSRASRRSAASRPVSLLPLSCTGNECAEGGNIICGSRNATCLASNKNPCFTCAALPSSQASAPANLACGINECASGGDFFCSVQGLNCSPSGDFPCFTCEQAASSMAAVAATTTVTPARPRPLIPSIMPAPECVCDAGKRCVDNVCLTSVQLAALPPFCGNARLDTGESCDEGSNNTDKPNAYCRRDCTYGRCGDKILDTPLELCDDGNTLNGDGCSNQCLPERPLTPEEEASRTLPSSVIELPFQQPGVIAQQPSVTPLPGSVIPGAAVPPATADTGPAALAVMAAGAAAGYSWIRRKKK